MARTGGKTNRNDPKNAASSDATTTVMDFQERFPDDAACLDELVRMLYPDGIYCPTDKKVTKHHRIKSRPAYSCQFCGHMEYPMKGTIFEGSSTSLKLWFYAIYLMASTRCGISAKQLEREVGVSYPTALRMFRQIRSLLTQDDEMLDGTAERRWAECAHSSHGLSSIRSTTMVNHRTLRNSSSRHSRSGR